LVVQERERDGIVTPGTEADAVLENIAARLLAFRDQGTRWVIARRGQTALGAVPAKIMEDNTDEWRGDHCI
jgi:hypothetical protein